MSLQLHQAGNYKQSSNRWRRLGIWKSGNLGIWKSGNLEVWKSGNPRIWKSGKLGIMENLNLEICECRKRTKKETNYSRMKIRHVQNVDTVLISREEMCRPCWLHFLKRFPFHDDFHVFFGGPIGGHCRYPSYESIERAPLGSRHTAATLPVAEKQAQNQPTASVAPMLLEISETHT